MISIPFINSVGDVYSLHWEKENIKMRIDRIREHSDSTSGEVLITLKDHHLYHARANMLSPHSKKILANELTERLDSLDWHTLIEQAFTKTLLLYRRGEPVVVAGNLPKRDTPRFRLKPFVLEEQLSALYAYGGSAKTYFSLFLALMVQCGQPMLNMEVQKGNTLFLDWESSLEIIDEAVKAIKQGMNITSPEIPFYRRCDRLLANDIAEIQAEVMDKNIQFVIIDSAGMASGFSADFHSPAIEMLRALRTLKISVLIIDHKPKEGNSMFGSVYKTNECRSTWEIKARQDEGSSSIDIGIFHTKANLTRKFPPRGFEITFQGTDDYTEAITFATKNISEMPSIEEGLSNKNRIINILKQGALKVSEIVEMTNIKENIVRAELSRNKHTFVKTESDKYGLLLEALEDYNK